MKKTKLVNFSARVTEQVARDVAYAMHDLGSAYDSLGHAIRTLQDKQQSIVSSACHYSKEYLDWRGYHCNMISGEFTAAVKKEIAAREKK